MHTRDDYMALLYPQRAQTLRAELIRRGHPADVVKTWDHATLMEVLAIHGNDDELDAAE